MPYFRRFRPPVAAPRTIAVPGVVDLPLDELQMQYARLAQILTSGVLELEQPSLGRTQFRSLEEVQQAMAWLADAIADAGGAGAAAKQRRPIYPVAREV